MPIRTWSSPGADFRVTSATNVQEPFAIFVRGGGRGPQPRQVCSQCFKVCARRQGRHSGLRADQGRLSFRQCLEGFFPAVFETACHQAILGLAVMTRAFRSRRLIPRALQAQFERAGTARAPIHDFIRRGQGYSNLGRGHRGQQALRDGGSTLAATIERQLGVLM